MTPHLPFRAALVLAAALLSGASTAGFAQGQDPDADGTTNRREWAYPSRGPAPGQRGARAVDPNGSGLGPWYGSVSAGLGWFDGDGLSNSTGFAAEGRLACDLTDE